MGIFKTQEEKREKALRELEASEERQRIWERKEELTVKLKQVIIFPKTKTEYEALVGYETELIRTGNNNLVMYRKRDYYSPSNWGFIFDNDNKVAEILVNEGIEAIIDCKFLTCENYHTVYGIPVKKKEKQ